MPEFRITFGQKYRREAHPVIPAVHPDGWVAVEATDVHEARSKVAAALGMAWCDVNEPRPNDLDWYPRGELARLVTP